MIWFSLPHQPSLPALFYLAWRGLLVTACISQAAGHINDVGGRSEIRRERRLLWPSQRSRRRVIGCARCECPDAKAACSHLVLLWLRNFDQAEEAVTSVGGCQPTRFQ